MKRILAIDDDKVSLGIMSDMLEESGFEVQTATSALDANRFPRASPGSLLLQLHTKLT